MVMDVPTIKVVLMNYLHNCQFDLVEHSFDNVINSIVTHASDIQYTMLLLQFTGAFPSYTKREMRQLTFSRMPVFELFQ